MRRSAYVYQQGFLVITVVLVLAVLSAMALMISTSASLDNAVVAKHTDGAALDYVAKSGMAHMTWQLAQNTSCTNYTSLPATPFGLHSYSASVTPTSGSPVSVSAVGELTTGAAHTISRDSVKSYQAPNTLFLQPGSESDDAEIWAQAPNNNYGDSAETWVSSASNDTTRSLLRFTMDGIPAAATVLSATLSLRRQSGSGADEPVSAHRVTNQWSETEVTWNNRKSGTNWDTPGGDFENLAVAMTPVGPPNQRFEWRITPLVQDWVDGSYPNNGVALVSAIAGMSGQRFYTSDEANLDRRPSLSVTYACECGTTCTVPTSSGYYLDEFNSRTCTTAIDYVGSDGTLDWTGNAWSEVDNNASCDGSVKITEDQNGFDPGNNKLRFLGNNKAIEREVDLSSFATAFLSFDYRRQNLPNENREVRIELSTDGGDNWDQAGVIEGPIVADNEYLSETIDISAYISANTLIRLISRDLSNNETIYFDNLQISETDAAPGLFAHWKFDEASGLVASDTEGNHDGDLFNTPTWVATGQIDGALRFDGIDDRVEVPHDDTLSLTSAFTISAWVYNESPSIADSYRIVSKESVGTNDSYWLSFQGQGLWMGVGGEFFSPAMTPESDRWYHLAASFDDAADEIVMYVDGAEVLRQSTTATITPNTDPLLIGSNWEGFKTWDGILDDVRIYDRVLTPAEVSEIELEGESGGGGSGSGLYVETYQEWSATQSDQWQVKDLSGLGVPPDAVVEVAVINSNTSQQRWGGVRRVGSSLDRRFELHEAEGGGEDVVVMHVQADASSQIEHYSDNTGDIYFSVMGYWTSGVYEERFQEFDANSQAAWVSHNLAAYAVPAGATAEIVISNSSTDTERQGGVRETGSSFDRLMDIHEAESGGVDTATMLVNADGSADAKIEVYAESLSSVPFTLVGYWSTPPGVFTEADGELDPDAPDSTWANWDLGDEDVPADVVVYVLLSNEETSAQNNTGARRVGSNENRRWLRLQEAESGGSDSASWHVNADGNSTIQYFDEDASRGHRFEVLGWWVPLP